jgi:uncharacterized protein DUF397
MATSENQQIDFDDASWRTSSFSARVSCVETTNSSKGIAIRHSKIARGAVIEYAPEEWKAFILGAKNGEFDLDAEGKLPD